MGRYRKIDTRIWNDAKFSALSNEGKLLFLFLLTHPHMTSLGAMRATLTGLAAELGWPTRSLREAFGEAFRKGLVEHDETVCFVCLPNFLKYNGPESPNVVKSWRDSLDLIPECESKAALLQRVKAFVERLPEGFRKALPEVFRKSMPNPEQEQEQEQEYTPIAPKGACARFTKPTIEEVSQYCRARGNVVDPQSWLDHYESNGWRVGRNRMKDWKASVRTWERSEFAKPASVEAVTPRALTDEELKDWKPQGL